MGINYRVRRVRVCHPIRLSDLSNAPTEMSVEMEAVPSDGVSIVAQRSQKGCGLPPAAERIEVHTVRLAASAEATSGSIALLPSSVEGGTHFPASIDVSIRLSPVQFDEILGLITSALDVEAVLIEIDERNETLTLDRLSNNEIIVTWAFCGDESRIQMVPVVGIMLSYKPRSGAR